MHELGTNVPEGFHNTLPLHVSEHCEDQNVPNRLQRASDNAPIVCYEMLGDVDKCESLPRERAELEDAAHNSPPNASTAADKLAAPLERQRRGRRQGSDSPTKQESRGHIELADSVHLMDTDGGSRITQFPRPSQQHATMYRRPIREKATTRPPNSYHSALPNEQSQNRKIVGSGNGQSTGPPSPRPPSSRDRRSMTWPYNEDGDEGHQDLQMGYHHSPSRNHPKPCDRQYVHERKK